MVHIYTTHIYHYAFITEQTDDVLIKLGAVFWFYHHQVLKLNITLHYQVHLFEL